MKKLLITVLLLLSGATTFGQSMVTKMYAAVLGNQNVKKEYMELAHQALKDFNVDNSCSVSIKKANPVGSALALVPVSSFTAFGIWLDEEYLDKCSSSEVLFQIYHEAAHYQQCHHQKLLAAAAGLSGGLVAGLVCCNKILREKNYSHHVGITAAAGVITAAAILAILPSVVKRQERWADIEAAKKLCAIGREDVVAVHKQNLRHYSSEAGNLWWFSSKEQADYLDDVISKS